MKCDGCAASVKSGLAALKEVKSRKAGVAGAEKTLNIEAEESVMPQVLMVIEKVGFKA